MEDDDPYATSEDVLSLARELVALSRETRKLREASNGKDQVIYGLRKLEEQLRKQIDIQLDEIETLQASVKLMD